MTTERREQDFHRAQGFAPTERFFEGHFEGTPIVPGAMLLAYADQCLSRMSKGIETVLRVKFLSPLGPDTPLTLRISLDQDTARLRWMTSDTVIAQALVGTCDA